MRLRLPGVADRSIRQAFGILERWSRGVVQHGQAQERVVLRSPNGTLWNVTVTDAGALVVTAVS